MYTSKENSIQKLKVNLTGAYTDSKFDFEIIVFVRPCVPGEIISADNTTCKACLSQMFSLNFEPC